jgi:glutathione S-transferase
MFGELVGLTPRVIQQKREPRPAPSGGVSGILRMNVLVGLTAPLAFYSRRQLEGALDRCRALAERIESELRDKGPEHFVDEFSLADFCASLERAADVLQQKSGQLVQNTPAPMVKGLRARGRQRHR